MRIGREEARRIAIRAQLLDADRPTDLLEVVGRLTFLQLDPVAAVAPSADLVAWSRLGDRYEPAHLQRALETDRTLFEHRDTPTPKEAMLALLRPMSSLGLHLADMAAWPTAGGQVARWLAANEGFRQRVLDQLGSSGPLQSKAIADTAEEPWPSTGWTNNRNVSRMLEFLLSRGEIAVAGRRGRQRLWDIAERVYPAGVPVVSADEARRQRDEQRLRAFGVARPELVGDAGEPVEIEGTPGVWRLDPAASADGFEGRTTLLSPFDRLIHDRTRALELFDFDFTLEMYKPQAQRRWGYYALPVLHHDRLVGKVDAKADRKTGRLQVNAIHEDVPFTRAMRAAADAELEALAAWLGLELSRGA